MDTNSNDRGTLIRGRWGLTVTSDENREDLAQPSAPGLCLSKVYTRAEYTFSFVIRHEMILDGITVCSQCCEVGEFE